MPARSLCVGKALAEAGGAEPPGVGFKAGASTVLARLVLRRERWREAANRLEAHALGPADDRLELAPDLGWVRSPGSTSVAL